MRSWKPHAGKHRAMAFSPDGAILATTGGTAGNVWLWDLPSGDERRRVLRGGSLTHALAFSPDGRFLAFAGHDGGVVLLPTAPGGSEPGVLRTPRTVATTLSFSPADGRLVGANAMSFFLWETPTGETQSRPDLTTTRGPLSAPVLSICFTPDGSRLLVGAADLELWPPDLSGAIGFVRTNKRNGIKAIAVTRDGSRAAVVIRNTVRVCSLETLKFERTLHWGSDMVYATSFTPDGRTLLTAGADGTVRFWDVATGVETRRFDWGIGKVSVAAFAPDGLTCAAGSDSGQIVVWDVDA